MASHIPIDGSPILNVSRLLRAAATRQPRVPTVVWHLSPIDGAGGRGRTLSEWEASSAIDEMAEVGIARLRFADDPARIPPLLRLIAQARRRGISTGVLIDPHRLSSASAERLAAAGTAEVSLRLDGALPLREFPLTFDDLLANAAAAATRAHAAGLPVSIRVPLSPMTVPGLDLLACFAECVGIRAVYLHHRPRGRVVCEDDLSRNESRGALDRIATWARALAAAGTECDLFTVGSSADGAYYFLKLLTEGDTPRADRAWNEAVRDAPELDNDIAIASDGTVTSGRLPGASIGSLATRSFRRLWDQVPTSS